MLAGAPLEIIFGVFMQFPSDQKQGGKQCPYEFHRLVLLYVSDILRVMFYVICASVTTKKPQLFSFLKPVIFIKFSILRGC